jgi:hypothetical protein
MYIGAVVWEELHLALTAVNGHRRTDGTDGEAHPSPKSQPLDRYGRVRRRWATEYGFARIGQGC